ncbi:uncharacterized protein PGTG_19857 [Puccinia graminis f. sp. tritici CRL 75-36-700-3]|uniref:Uncharacterized protein n=1 Tax=Puccinia graminis f. sp. tritici (strain CRL 75-36-700-3 / race SCCL) TaxID=418459 RepID=E3LB97_PUCGT|nr:uncharacterized protein PGTG_19857 [Puccinia graminis f. sp. tritici CRL 75-36-700-3]EFP93822.2 hypothetical protein PGTG_19857 [Puccinia graminis f. sp. tritici CRL 75-36-700-3]
MQRGYSRHHGHLGVAPDVTVTLTNPLTAHETPNETPRCRSARERHAIVRGASGKVTFRAGASPNCPYTTGAPRRQTVEGSDGQTDLPRPGQTFLSADETRTEDLGHSWEQLQGLLTTRLQQIRGDGTPVILTNHILKGTDGLSWTAVSPRVNIRRWGANPEELKVLWWCSVWSYWWHHLEVMGSNPGLAFLPPRASNPTIRWMVWPYHPGSAICKSHPMDAPCRAKVGWHLVHPIGCPNAIHHARWCIRIRSVVFVHIDEIHATNVTQLQLVGLANRDFCATRFRDGVYFAHSCVFRFSKLVTGVKCKLVSGKKRSEWLKHYNSRKLSGPSNAHWQQ